MLTIDEFHREKEMSKSCIVVEFLSLNVIEYIYLNTPKSSHMPQYNQSWLTLFIGTECKPLENWMYMKEIKFIFMYYLLPINDTKMEILVGIK